MIIPSSPADRKAIKSALDEISGSMTRIEAERDLIKEAIAETCDKFQLNKKTFRKMAKVYHKQNFTQEREEHEHFEEMYETITNTTSMKDAA
jgi:tRNA(Ser,Leu) C12 N-acetylase TAN1